MISDMEQIIERLVNSEEISDWNNFFSQKIEKARLENSEYMKEYSKDFKLKNSWQIIAEIKKMQVVRKIDQKIDQKIKKKNKNKLKITKKYNKATLKNNKQEMEQWEKQYEINDNKIKTLNQIKMQNQADLERFVKVLKENFENKMTLSDEDRIIRNVEHKIWKIILDGYFTARNDRILVLDEYENWSQQFENRLQELKQSKNLDSKSVKTISNIVKTLYFDMARDKMFLEKEKIIKTDSWENIDLTELDLKQVANSKCKFYLN